jgi:hypothetical protein
MNPEHRLKETKHIMEHNSNYDNYMMCKGLVVVNIKIIVFWDATTFN